MAGYNQYFTYAKDTLSLDDTKAAVWAENKATQDGITILDKAIEYMKGGRAFVSNTTAGTTGSELTDTILTGKAINLNIDIHNAGNTTTKTTVQVANLTTTGASPVRALSVYTEAGKDATAVKNAHGLNAQGSFTAAGETITNIGDDKITLSLGATISTQEAAQQALDGINSAILSKDNVRAHLGALQNRFENTINNLTIQAENLQAAESRISDVDVATEMTEFVRNQILAQSAVAMLAQANSMPQMAMQLIGG